MTISSRGYQEAENKFVWGLMGRMKVGKGNAEQYVGSAGKGT